MGACRKLWNSARVSTMDSTEDLTDTVEGLKAQREELLRAREQIEMVLTRIDTQLDQLAPPAPAEEHGEPSSPARSRPRPLRLMVLDGLDDLGWMTFSRQMMLYLRARYGRDVSPTRFSSLAKDEIAAFTSKRPRSVYLCHGLVHDRPDPAPEAHRAPVRDRPDRRRHRGGLGHAPLPRRGPRQGSAWSEGQARGVRTRTVAGHRSGAARRAGASR